MFDVKSGSVTDEQMAPTQAARGTWFIGIKLLKNENNKVILYIIYFQMKTLFQKLKFSIWFFFQTST